MGLVLSRRVGETITLRDDRGVEVHIRLTEAEGRAARLLIDAPPSVRIWRAEIDPQGYRQQASRQKAGHDQQPPAETPSYGRILLGEIDSGD